MRSLFRLGVIVELIERVTGPAKRALGAITSLENAAKKAAAVAALAGSIGMAGTAASQAAEMWRGAVFDMLAPTVAVQDSMAAMRTVTTSTMGSMQKSLEATRAAAVAWSKAHSDSADQFLRTSYQMASAGLNDVQAIEGTRVALTVARATMADSAETANTLAILYNNLGDKTADVRTEMTRLGDILAKTQAMYQIANLGQLTEGLKYATPAAVSMGIGVDELNVALGALNSAGLQGGMAGTAYSAAMRQMLKASKDLGFQIVRNADGGMSFVGTLVAIRQQFGEASTWSDELRQRMQEAFGDEGLRAITLLVGKTGELTSAWKDVAGAAGTAAEAQKAFEDAPTGQMEILLNNVAALKMEVADGLLPMLNDVIPRVKELIGSFSEWAKAHPGLARTALLVLAVGAAVLTIIAPLLTAASGFLMMASGGMQAAAWIGRQFLKVGSAIGSAASMVETLQIRWLYAKDALQSGWTALSGWARSGATAIGNAASSVANLGRTAAAAAWNGLKSLATGLYQMAAQAIRTAVTAMPGLIASVWSFTAALLANPITWIVLGIVALIAAVVLLWKNWDKVSAWLAQAWDRVKSAWAAAIDWVKGLLTGVVDFFRNWGIELLAVVFPFVGMPLLIMKHWDQISAFFSKLWATVKAAAVAGLESMGQWIMDKLTSIYDWLLGLKDTFLNAGKALWEAFVDGLKSVIMAPYNLVKGAVQKVRDLLPGSDAKEGPLSSLTRSGRALVTTFSGGMVSELPDLRSTLNVGLADLLPAPAMATAGGPDMGPGFLPIPTFSVESQTGKRSERQFTIQRLILQVQQMDSVSDLWEQLSQLADEVEVADGEVTDE